MSPEEIIWRTDNRSLLDALGGQLSKASTLTQALWEAITKHLDNGKNDHGPVVSHCGIQQNEIADKFANQAVQMPLTAYCNPKTPFEVFKASARSKKCNRSTELRCLPLEYV